MLTKQEIILWHTTPGELRKIADEMERKIPDLTLGDSTATHVVTDKIQLKICADPVHVHLVQGDPEYAKEEDRRR